MSAVTLVSDPVSVLLGAFPGAEVVPPVAIPHLPEGLWIDLRGPDGGPPPKRNPRPPGGGNPGGVSDLGEAALAYAAQGWSVLPLERRGKRPLLPHGFVEASTDAATVARWWSRWPTANVGIAIPPGVIVVDVDERHGGAKSLSALERRFGALPRNTLSAATGNGGWHLIYGVAAGTELRRSVGSERNGRLGIDLLVGGSGYLVAAPSVTTEQYRWLSREPVAPAPPWLVDLVAVRAEPVPSARRRSPGPTADTGSREEAVLRVVAEAVEGNRNAALYWAAARFVERRVPDAEARLLEAARQCGLGEDEARATVRSATRRLAATP